MKKIITSILAIMAFALPIIAQDSKGTNSPTPIILETLPKDIVPNPKPFRSPMRIPVGAWYNATAETISIIYYGEASGEVNLYQDGQLIDSSSEINSTFQISESGFYSIEINTDSWTATGGIQI